MGKYLKLDTYVHEMIQINLLKLYLLSQDVRNWPFDKKSGKPNNQNLKEEFGLLISSIKKITFLLLENVPHFLNLPHTFFYDQLIATKSVVDSIFTCNNISISVKLKRILLRRKKVYEYVEPVSVCMKYLIGILPSKLRFRV